MATKTRPGSKTATVTVPAASPQTEAVEKVIRQAIDTFNAGDLDSYFELFADDVQCYTGIHTPLRFEGLPAWKTFIEGIRKGTKATYEQRQPSLRSYNEDTVVANHYFVFTGEGPDGAMESQTGRASMVFVEHGGSWRVVNQHFSPMF